MWRPRIRRSVGFLWIFLLASGTSAAAEASNRAVLTSVRLGESTSETCRFLLDVGGPVRRVDTMALDRGRFVFDLPNVAWEGPVRRVRPRAPGVREFRYSQLSRDPLVARFVVEVGAGWSCRHEPSAIGVTVTCGGPAVAATRQAAAGGPDIAVVRGIGLMSPISGFTAADLIDRSLEYVPRDLVRDGLPNFGSVRDDWQGKARSHKGLDIYGDLMSIQAAADGTVAGAGTAARAGGWIKIDHGNGVETVYVHVSKINVRSGDRVRKGQRIAVVAGAAGNAVEPQLHFEVKLEGSSVDPVSFIYESASDELRSRIMRANTKLAVLARERAAQVAQGVN
jgi:hypothetical protein